MSRLTIPTHSEMSLDEDRDSHADEDSVDSSLRLPANAFRSSQGGPTANIIGKLRPKLLR